MADWAYTGWEDEATNPLRLAALRSHIAEVTRDLQGGQSVSGNGSARTKFDLVGYIRDLRSERARLERITGTINGGTSVGRFVEPGIHDDCGEPD